MTDRIKRMIDLVYENKIYPAPKSIEYDRMYLLMPDVIMNTKRLCDYMLAQDVVINDVSMLVGQMRFDGSVPSDLFHRTGHNRFAEVSRGFYNKPLENLVTFEWQHSTPNFFDVIENGIEGILERINKSKQVHEGDSDKQLFLEACELVCHGIIAWENKCADECRKKAEQEQNPTRREELLKLAQTLDRVPLKPATSFYEAIESVYFCFDFLPDSIGTPDRYLFKWYDNDIKKGIITREQAGELLQELFIRLQAHTPVKDNRFYRGGESHFSVGGYAENGEDGFNDLSALILESLMDLPLFIPQVSLRWTPKTPFEVLYHAMDLERKDPNKRIAFVSDVPRVKSFMENCSMEFKDAIKYTMVGCNEPALQGAIWFGGTTSNVARSLTNTLYGRKDDLLKCETFDEFYEIYKQELYSDLGQICKYSNLFNVARSKDENILSTIFLKDSVENGVSVTKGGALGITGSNMMGVVCVIDSLTIIKQFVYDEKLVTMEQMLSALEANWEGYEELHTLILKKGKFFGNNYEISDEMARRFTTEIYNYFHDKKNVFGKPFLFGNLTGYNQHYTWFGALTKATPDGRADGESFMVGIGQVNGKDREGLSALLSSVAQFDPTGIFCGPTVTNINLDASLIRNDDNFEKTVKMIETYFKAGGLHVQLNSVTREELIAAKETPDKYKTLRVRVSGFSDYFVNLNSDLQDNVIERTKIDG